MLKGKSYWYLCITCNHVFYRERRHNHCGKLTVKIPEKFYNEMFGVPKEPNREEENKRFNKWIKKRLLEIKNKGI